MVAPGTYRTQALGSFRVRGSTKEARDRNAARVKALAAGGRNVDRFITSVGGGGGAGGRDRPGRVDTSTRAQRAREARQITGQNRRSVQAAREAGFSDAQISSLQQQVRAATTWTHAAIKDDLHRDLNNTPSIYTRAVYQVLPVGAPFFHQGKGFNLRGNDYTVAILIGDRLF